MNLVDTEPREYPRKDSLTPIKDMKKVQINTQISQTTHINSNLSPGEEATIIRMSKWNIDLFTWKPVNILDIDPSIVCCHLMLDPTIKPVSWRKRKDDEETRTVIEDEVEKLQKVGFIREIKYSTWWANIVVIKKEIRKVANVCGFQ